MLLFIIIKGLNINIYNINEYINFEIYILGEKGIILIKREFYIVDNLTIKVFININILKPEKIILNVIRNIIIFILYKNLEILIIFNN